MQIRSAVASDVESIVALVNAAFRVERFLIDGDRTSLPDIQRLLSTGQFLLAEEHGALAGCTYVEVRGERGYLGMLSINPTRQRGGIGSRLMAAAEDHCRYQGCRFADLRVVNLREELPGYYRRLGYRETGTEPFPAEVPTKVPCHLVTMSKEL